jgi:hypothetical protein
MLEREIAVSAIVELLQQQPRALWETCERREYVTDVYNTINIDQLMSNFTDRTVEIDLPLARIVNI